AEGGTHLADLQLQAGWQRGERDEAFFEVDALFAEADEEIGARVRVDHFLEAHLALMHFERWRSAPAVASGGADEVSNHADVGVENFGSRTAGPADRYRFGRG